MLKLKIGQEVTTKQGNKYIVLNVFEKYVVLTINNYSTISHYTNEAYLNSFKYEEPFEPKEGDIVFYLDKNLMLIKSETLGVDKPFNVFLDRLFPTESKAQEYLEKIKKVS